MLFRTVKDAVVEILGDGAESRFRVLGYQRQSKSTSELKDNNRLVQVYYSDGNFPKTSGRQRGPKTHDITIEIDMSASAAAEGDVSVLESSTSTAIQKAAAIAAIKEAAQKADESIDVLIDAVYQILMDARNEGLGLDKGDISQPWVDRIQKDASIERGDLVLKTANMKYNCRVQESVPGAVGAEPETVIFNSGVPVGDTEGAGVLTENVNEEE
jgi:hypothetical protein